MQKLVLFSVIILVSFLPAFGDEVSFFIPKWFDGVYQYWKGEQITDKEFADAIFYLQNVDVMKLSDKEDTPIANFLATYAVSKQVELGNLDFSNCSLGWYITGYFTPLESDYTGRFITVNVNGATYKFREGFVEEIKTEGWGRTISGDYLGWYDESFHFSENPLDAAGNSLEVNAIAVDPLLVPANSRIMIPTLPSPWDIVVFTGSDTGTAIVGRHIDVYTGEGTAALDEAYRITGYNNTVCLEVK